ncbi:MAG: IS5 family transposase [Planctomycetes bacterium]|nr:IS5 family transposase [Planctomycetota bacterium]
MPRHRLTDEQWALIKDLFPLPKRMGRPPSDPRDMIDGILWILNTGAQWRDLPPDFGPRSTVWDHFDRWNHDGTLQAVLDRLRDDVEIDEELWCVDGTTVRAAKCAAGGGKGGIRRSPTITRWGAVAAV